MNSEIKLIASHSLVRAFVLCVLKTVKKNKLAEYKERIVIDADLVTKIPRGEESILKKKEEKKVQFPVGKFEPQISLMDAPEEIEPPVEEIIIPKRFIMQRSPIKVPVKIMSPQKRQFPAKVPQVTQVRKITPQENQNTEISEEDTSEYGKITPLLKDHYVYFIECLGANQPIRVMKAGQKQLTKIILNEQEIKSILERISSKLHIPLFDGVFRAAVDNFTINAVVSNIIGSKFIIQKQASYAMER